MSGSVIVAGARTPMGRLLGSLKGFSAAELGGIAIKGALEKAGVSGDQVQYVIMGHVIQAGAGQITARQAAVAGGIPLDVPALTINKVCLSGIDAIALADQLIRAGEFDIVVAGGMESMTNAPHLLTGSREGVKYGEWTMKDSMAHDALFCAIDQVAMGQSTENYNARYGLTRQEQDEFSARSHQLAARAAKDGLFDDEIVTGAIPQRKGEPIEFRDDEGVRSDTTADSLAGLRPAFAKDGTITAGSASQISDGAAAVVVMSRAKAEELGLTWLAEIGRARRRGRAGRLAARAARQRRDPRLRAGGHRPERPRPAGAQRGLRRRRDRLDQEARRRPGARQRQRRRDRDGPSGRDVGRADRAAPGARAQAPRRRGRGCGALRRRRAGRRPDRAGSRA